MIAILVFIVGSGMMLLMFEYLFLYIFGRPINAAKQTMFGGALIQHFETNKSATFKNAIIHGGSFQHKSVSDGTLAATANSVQNVSGRNLVITYAQLGVTIPTHILAAISLLVHNGTNNIKELRTRLTSTDTLGQENIAKEEILTGYDFNNFRILLKQSKEEKLIPLVVESVQNFVERTIIADYNEKKIKIIDELKKPLHAPDNSTTKLVVIAICCAVILIIGMLYK